MNWLKKRLSEGSTGAGVAVALQMAKAVPALAPYAQLLDVLTGLAATHAVVMPEKGAV